MTAHIRVPFKARKYRRIMDGPAAAHAASMQKTLHVAKLIDRPRSDLTIIPLDRHASVSGVDHFTFVVLAHRQLVGPHRVAGLDAAEFAVRQLQGEFDGGEHAEPNKYLALSRLQNALKKISEGGL